MPDLRINAGELRRRVQIQAETLGAPSPMGSTVETFNAVAVVPAKLEWMTGTKLYTALQVHPEATVEVTIRWDDRVSEKSRFVTEDKQVLYAVSCIRDERRRWMRLLCKERP